MSDEWGPCAGCEKNEKRVKQLEAELRRVQERLEDVGCEFCEEGAKCCEKFDNSYGEMLRPFITVCTTCWNKKADLSRVRALARAEAFEEAAMACEPDVVPGDDLNWPGNLQEELESRAAAERVKAGLP